MPGLTLGKKQEIFAEHLATLVTMIFAQGNKVRMGEVERSKQEAARKGFPNSNHTRRLAADLHLISPTGRYLKKTEEYAKFGKIWESFTGEIDGHYITFSWGGRFQDGNHFSLKHGTVR